MPETALDLIFNYGFKHFNKREKSMVEYKPLIEVYEDVNIEYTQNWHCQIGNTIFCHPKAFSSGMMATAKKRAWIKGKGTIVNDGFIDFEPQEHGIIMCIYHIVPLLDYDAVGVDPFNIKTSAEDFAIPEFDNIGMQPTDAVQLNWKLKDLSSWFNDTILGYAPRYAEYKTAIDKVHGAFTTSLRSWYSPMSYDYMLNVLTSGKENWYIFKKVNPDILDSIFGVNADNTVDTDQFLVNSYFDVKCVLPLDRNGLPY